MKSMYIKKLNIGVITKINILLLVIMIVVLVATLLFCINAISKGMNDIEQARLLNMTEIAYNIIDTFNKRVNSGEMTLEQAKKRLYRF